MKILTSMQNNSDSPLSCAATSKAKGKIIATRPVTKTLLIRSQIIRPRLAAMRRGTAKNMARLGVALIAGLTVTFGTAFAGDFDGSKPLICATIDAMDCVSGENCTKGRPGDMGAPAFMRIDFAKKTIGGPKRTTPIVAMDTSENQVLMQGNEQGYGWTFALDQEEGKFSATLVNRDGVFVLFGSCTPP